MVWLGSGCGSVGSAVASILRGLEFDSSHRKKYWIFSVNCTEKIIIRKMRPVMAYFFQKKLVWICFLKASKKHNFQSSDLRLNVWLQYHLVLQFRYHPEAPVWKDRKQRKRGRVGHYVGRWKPFADDPQKNSFSFFQKESVTSEIWWNCVNR